MTRTRARPPRPEARQKKADRTARSPGVERKPEQIPSDRTDPPPIIGDPAAAAHVPVLLEAVIEALAPRDGAVYIDGTFGAGGYSAALLAAARCRVIAIDRDPDALRRGAGLTAAHFGRLLLIEGRFGDMERLVAAASPGAIAGIALDLGVSSRQLYTGERGFSFRLDGPLDMRMGKEGESAADLVARLGEDELEQVIRGYGEERFARRVARAIVEARGRAPIRRTGELTDIVRAAIPRREPGIDAATRTFQALRIAVNDELRELDRGLAAAERLLTPGGRLAVVSFHSLEDTRVKSFLRERGGGTAAVSRHMPAPTPSRAPSFRLLGRRAVRPDADEVARNPRARSARLRAAERTSAPPWGNGDAYGDTRSAGGQSHDKTGGRVLGRARAGERVCDV